MSSSEGDPSKYGRGCDDPDDKGYDDGLSEQTEQSDPNVKDPLSEEDGESQEDDPFQTPTPNGNRFLVRLCMIVLQFINQFRTCKIDGIAFDHTSCHSELESIWLTVASDTFSADLRGDVRMVQDLLGIKHIERRAVKLEGVELRIRAKMRDLS